MIAAGRRRAAWFSRRDVAPQEDAAFDGGKGAIFTSVRLSEGVRPSSRRWRSLSRNCFGIFVEEIDGVGEEKLEISDSVVDTQSNLSANVLKKVLFKLGFAYPIVDQHDANLGLLLGIRNAIAHGDRLRIPKPEQVRDCVAAALDIMEFLQLEIYAALYERSFLRSAGPGSQSAVTPASA